MKADRVICNPIDLPYRYQDFGRGPLRAVYRESADPSIVRFRDRFYLFGSMSGGFHHSLDLVEWDFVPVPQFPVGAYAPDVRELRGQLFVTASRRGRGSPIFRSADPLTEPFTEVAVAAFPYWDPNFFEDDDGRVYVYWGCSNTDPLRGVEVDVDAGFVPIGDPVDLLSGAPEEHGWERPGESNGAPTPTTLLERVSARLFGTHSQTPYIEGAWMTKHDGRYYLQYAGPGTEYNIYADGFYTATSPLGPFTYSPASPFSVKPGGFITGAGHGSTFQDAHGNWWHAATMRISINHHFERRIGLFPGGFDEDGVLFCDQAFGDYPMTIPDGHVDPIRLRADRWMLQSYRARATATSSAAGHEPGLAADEDIRTWWAAGTNQPGEALTLDLGTERVVHAVQVNLADHDATTRKPRRRLRDPAASREAFRTVVIEDHPCRYRLECSVDGETWATLHDGATDESDRPHRLVRLPDAVAVRYVRIAGISTPWDSTFAVSGLRVFGANGCRLPSVVVPDAVRLEPRTALVQWAAAAGAEGYNVRYGRRPDRLYNSWQVWGQTTLELTTLNAGERYWVAVDSYNSGGVTVGEPVAIGDA